MTEEKKDKSTWDNERKVQGRLRPALWSFFNNYVNSGKAAKSEALNDAVALLKQKVEGGSVIKK